MKIVTVLFGLVLAGMITGSSAVAETPKTGKFWVYVGTHTGPKSKGIYRFELDAATGKASNLELAGEMTSPSFLAIHPTGKFLYAVGEVDLADGKKGGGLAAFGLDPATGKLTKLNTQSSGGGGPCHIVLDKEGKTALVANYGGGSAASLPIGADGKLAEAASLMQHKGKSVDKGRQEAPHAHSINVDPGNKFAVVADLGLDQVLVYRLDPVRGTLTPNDPPYAAVAQGAGPRHFAFHPSSKYGYVINEMGNTVTVFDYDATKGVLTKKQDIGTLPKDFKGKSYTSEIVVHPSGKFLYGSNRGHDSIAFFSIDPKTGELTAVQNQPEGIKWPRNFAIDPTGQWLIVGNEQGNSIVFFRIDPETGKLTSTGEKLEVASPMCIRFLKKGE